MLNNITQGITFWGEAGKLFNGNYEGILMKLQQTWKWL